MKCDFLELTSEELGLHMEQIHSVEDLNCHDCNYQGNNKSELRTHKIKNHKKIDPFRCIICGEIFKTNASMNEHMVVVHKNEGKIECSR